MAVFKKIMKGLTVIVFFLLFITLLFFKQESYQLYKVLTFFNEDVISQNFRGIKDIFRTKTIVKSDSPYQFPKAAKSINLPSNFTSSDSTLFTQDFLEHTLTDALVIIQNDTIIYENYSNGFSPNDVHISWSMAKSVISGLFGIAVDEGYINSIEETVTDYLPELKNTGYDGIRIKDVLQMSSGVGFNEDYGDFNSDINIMGRYFALGMPMAEFAKTLKNKYEPGTYNHYVSINTQVLGMILTEATGISVTQYMQEKMWSPLGASSDAYWIIDNSDMEFVLGGLNATALDYAKLGQLYLDSGRWNGKQIVPESWVLASITPDAPHLMPGKRKNAYYKEGYGYQWWIPINSKGEFNAQGIYGQYIYIDPNRDLVIVRLASNYHFKNDADKIYHNLEIDMFRAIANQLD
ncbi:MAG: serine hydrolase [Reichenbachiella sp.]